MDMYYALPLIILEWNDSCVVSKWVATSTVIAKDMVYNLLMFNTQKSPFQSLNMALYIQDYILCFYKLLFM